MSVRTVPEQKLPGVVYAPEHEIRRYLEAGALRMQSLRDALRHSFSRNAERLALLDLDGATTYGELDDISDRLAAGFLSLGVKPLDRVIFQISNCKELIYAFCACIKAGLIPVCTLAAHREQEIGYLAKHSGAVLHCVLGDDPKFDDVAFAEAMQAKAPSLRFIVQAREAPRGRAIGLRSLVAGQTRESARRALDLIEHDPMQVAVFQLSGGTTGVPKIIPQFHASALATMLSTADWYGFREDDIMFNPLPMMHNLHMSCCFGPMLLKGGATVIVPNVLPETLIKLLELYPPTWAYISAAILTRIEGALRGGLISLSRARGIISANNSSKFRAILGAPVYHQYGMTEGALAGTRAGDPDEAIAQTVGRPFSPYNLFKILRPESEEEVPPGETGECVVKGPFTLHGYYNAPERNRVAFTSDGWYRSGDLMSEREIDGKRYLVFQGRLKDVVDRGGEKINAEEVELACTAHPAIAAAAVVGMPDEVYGERTCVFVIPSAGMQAPNVAELGNFLKTYGLAKFKWPERIEIVTEFPSTKSGKLLKSELKRMIAMKLRDENSRQHTSTN